LIIGGKYEVTRVLGEGGMGVVYEARHVDLARSVAVKVLRPDALRDAQAVGRFRREARVAASLKSDHVARILDFGTLDDGAPFMVMEHLVGKDLDAELHDRGALPVAEAASILVEACDAIREAHALGVVHRDLKPGNIFLATEGDRRVAKVLDFGISKLVAEENVRMTQTQSAFGTPLYMSPEHIRSAKNVDHRTDIWSLGIILYEIVTGRVPFEAETATAVAVAIAIEPLVPASHYRPGLPPQLDAVLGRALEKDPTRRYQSVDAFAADLASLTSFTGAVALPSPHPHASAETSAALTTQGGPQKRGSLAYWALGLGAAVAIGAVVGFVAYRGMSPSVSSQVGDGADQAASAIAVASPSTEVAPTVTVVADASTAPVPTIDVAPSASAAVVASASPSTTKYRVKSGAAGTKPPVTSTATAKPRTTATVAPTARENPILL